jgi:hypothetical protein
MHRNMPGMSDDEATVVNDFPATPAEFCGRRTTWLRSATNGFITYNCMSIRYSINCYFEAQKKHYQSHTIKRVSSIASAIGNAEPSVKTIPLNIKFCLFQHSL